MLSMTKYNYLVQVGYGYWHHIVGGTKNHQIGIDNCNHIILITAQYQ